MMPLFQNSPAEGILLQDVSANRELEAMKRKEFSLIDSNLQPFQPDFYPYRGFCPEFLQLEVINARLLSGDNQLGGQLTDTFCTLHFNTRFSVNLPEILSIYRNTH